MAFKRQCLLWVNNRHFASHAPCPLDPEEQIFAGANGVAAKGQ